MSEVEETPATSAAEGRTAPSEEDHPHPPSPAAPSPAEETSILDSIYFRTVRPTDIPDCYAIEKVSYPEDEAASKSTLQYRQHHAARYFRCAVLGDEDEGTIVGFICSTRCRDFTAESMATHVPDGPLLAIHSVVVAPEYRKRGIASAMLRNYLEKMHTMEEIEPIDRVVLISKADKLTFYVHCGFAVVKPSSIVHGKETWYECEHALNQRQTHGIPCYIVDSFADVEQSGTGNPAAVVLLNKTMTTEDYHGEAMTQWMQTTAQEFNLSETAFLLETSEKDDDCERAVQYAIRYFTPSVEVDLCGHATLAAAAVLFQTLDIRHKVETHLVFQAKKDLLRATQASGGRNSQQPSARISMKFPIKPALPVEDDAPAKQMLTAALNIEADNVLFVGLSEMGDVLIEVTYESFLEIGYDGLNIDALAQWDGYTRGVIVCCQAAARLDSMPDDDTKSMSSVSVHSKADFVSRFFAPKAGIAEDPVTGSAHCTLAPYFCQKLSKDKVVGMQMSRRGGVVECQLMDDAVQLTGTAVTAVSGTLWL